MIEYGILYNYTNKVSDPQYFYLTVDGLLFDTFKTHKLFHIPIDGHTYQVEAHDLSVAIANNRFKTLRLWKVKGC